MTKGNSTEPRNPQMLLDAIEELHNTCDAGSVRADLLETFQCALESENFGSNADARSSLFFSFRHLYTFLLIVEMFYDPKIKGVMRLV